MSGNKLKNHVVSRFYVGMVGIGLYISLYIVQGIQWNPSNPDTLK